MDEIRMMDMSTILIGDIGNSITITKRFFFQDKLLEIKAWCNAHGCISTTQLAAIVKSKKSKVKRHARNMLGPDSNTGQGQGYARQLTMEQAVRIYIYGLLIRHLSQRDIMLTITKIIKRLKASGEILS